MHLSLVNLLLLASLKEKFTHKELDYLLKAYSITNKESLTLLFRGKTQKPPFLSTLYGNIYSCTPSSNN